MSRVVRDAEVERAGAGTGGEPGPEERRRRQPGQSPALRLVRVGLVVGAIVAAPRALVLPGVTLSAIPVAAFGRYMRSSMMETMTQDFIRPARAKGAGPRRVLFVHALRNALIPIVPLLGISLPAIVSGAVITEDIFNYPGLGKLAIDSAFNIDIPTLLGVTFVVTVATIVGNLVADILYAVVDPRIRYASA